MTSPAYNTVIIQLFDKLDIILKSYVHSGYSALADHLRYPLGLAATLYIVLLGIFISQGWVKLSMDRFVKSIVQIGLIYTFALNWDFFNEYLYNFINGGANEIGNVLLQATPIKFPVGEGINGGLQSVLTEVSKIGYWIWTKGSWHHISSYFTAGMMWLSGYILILVAVCELVVAKIMLAVLFAVTPLFVAFTLFKPTRRFFDSWIGAAAGFAFLIVFVSAIVALELNIMQWVLKDIYASKAENVRLIGFVPAMVVGFLCVVLTLRVAHIAQNIGGVVSTASGSSMMAATVGGFIGGSLGSIKFARGVVDRSAQIVRFPYDKTRAAMESVQHLLRRS